MKSFTISPPPGDPPMLQGNTGKITFTVTNTATRTVDGTVLAKPTAPAEESWFSFPEGATRSYQPGAVQSVSTTITAPPGTPAGTYTFRLDAKAEDNPDEDYTEGPSAQFILPEPPKPVPWWKRYWWIAVIVAVVLVGTVIAVLLLSGGDDEGVATPDPTEEVVEPKRPERNCEAITAPLTINTRQFAIGLTRHTVSAGSVGLGSYANVDDAKRVVQLGTAFKRRCSIGAVEYWLDGTDAPLPDNVDCVNYDPGKVEVVRDGSAFVVQDPQVTPRLGTLLRQADAEDLEKVAKTFKARCFIGRSPADLSPENPLAPRQKFRTSVMDFWL